MRTRLFPGLLTCAALAFSATLMLAQAPAHAAAAASSLVEFEMMTWPDGGSTPFRGEKAIGWEGGFRVPCVIRWPGVIKPGTVYGATDEIGLYAIENKAHIHDIHATILSLLGVDHESLTFSHNGRDERLTITSGSVIRDIIA